jgi:hypothetical protein
VWQNYRYKLIDQSINTCSLHYICLWYANQKNQRCILFFVLFERKGIFSSLSTSSCSLHNVCSQYRSDWHFEGACFNNNNNNRSIDLLVLIQMFNGWWSWDRHTLRFFFFLFDDIDFASNKLIFIKQVIVIKVISHLCFFLLMSPDS